MFPEYEEFRAEVRAFIGDNCPAKMRVEEPIVELNREHQPLWRCKVHAKGWIAPGRPFVKRLMAITLRFGDPSITWIATPRRAAA